MSTYTQSSNGEPTNYEILETINEFASATERRFEKLEGDMSSLKGDMSSLKGDMSSLKTDVGYLKSQMVTKEYLDDKLADLRGDIIVMLRKEDSRLSSLIELLKGKKVLTDEEAKTLTILQPLLQIP